MTSPSDIVWGALLVTAILCAFAAGQYWGYHNAVTSVDCSLCVCKAVAGVP